MKKFRTIKEIDALKNSAAYSKFSEAEKADIESQRGMIVAKNIIRSVNRTIESGYRKFGGHNTASRDILRNAAIRFGDDSIKTSSMYIGGINIPQISVSNKHIKSIMEAYGNDSFSKFKESLHGDDGEYRTLYNYNRRYNEYFGAAKASIENDIRTSVQGPIPLGSTYIELVEKTLKGVKTKDIAANVPEVMKAKAILDDFSSNYEKMMKALKELNKGELTAEASELMININKGKIRHLYNEGKFKEYNEKIRKIYAAVGLDSDRILEWDYNEDIEKDEAFGSELHGPKLKDIRKMFNL